MAGPANLSFIAAAQAGDTAGEFELSWPFAPVCGHLDL